MIHRKPTCTADLPYFLPISSQASFTTLTLVTRLSGLHACTKTPRLRFSSTTPRGSGKPTPYGNWFTVGTVALGSARITSSCFGEKLLSQRARQTRGFHLLKRFPLASDRLLVWTRVVQHDHVNIINATYAEGLHVFFAAFLRQLESVIEAPHLV